MNDSGLQWYHSWPAIAIWFIPPITPLFPIGLFLLVLRIRADRATRIVAGHILALLGWFVSIISIITILAAWSSGREGARAVQVFFIITALVGFFLIGKGGKMTRDGRKLRRYIGMVVNQEIDSLQHICTLTGTLNTEAVMADLQRLIDDGYLPGYRIDPAARRIERVLPEGPLAARGRVAAPPAGAQEVAFTCKSCGANNTVLVAPGSPAACEYCGTPARG